MMHSTARKGLTREMTLVQAEVKVRTEDRYILLLEQGPVRADRAEGCLLEPEIGDQVLAAWSQAGTAYILTVLKRGRPEVPSRLTPTSGRELVFQAPQVRIQGRETLSLTSPRMDLETTRGTASFGSFFVQGQWLKSRLERITTVARFIDTLAERVVERLGRSYRRIAQFEETKAGRIRTVVEGLLFLSSKNTSLTAEKRVKIDADKIHLG